MPAFPSIASTTFDGGCTVVANDKILCLEEASDGDGFMYELGRFALSAGEVAEVAYLDGGQVTGVGQGEQGMELAVGGVLEQEDIDMAVIMIGETCYLDGDIDAIAEELGYGGPSELASALGKAREVAETAATIRSMMPRQARHACVTVLVRGGDAPVVFQCLREAGATSVVEQRVASGWEAVRRRSRIDAWGEIENIVGAIQKLNETVEDEDLAVWVSPTVPLSW